MSTAKQPGRRCFTGLTTHALMNCIKDKRNLECTNDFPLFPKHP